MELSKFEKKAITAYVSAIAPYMDSKEIILHCRESVMGFMQTILIERYKYSDSSDEVLRDTTKTFFNSDFIGRKEGTKFVPHNENLQNIRDQINLIIHLRNPIAHPKDGDQINDDDLQDLSSQCVIGLRQILKWYINIHKKYYLNNITNLTTEQKGEVAHLFTTKINRTETSIVERETYYVILLIDSSQSMLWPFLKDPGNSNNDDSNDYKQAVGQVQKAMQFAHEKALNALRGSQVCRDGYLQLYQFTFNQKEMVLNKPEFLTPEGLDNVVKISSNNYYPEGRTALYDTIHRSLKVMYEIHLKPELDKNGRYDKVIIGVITDGEDTMLDGPLITHKINEIKQYLTILRGELRKSYLVSSVLIGLTGNEFTDNKLKEIRKEMNFDESISIIQADEHSIRKAFKLFTGKATNV
jgi:hypothetical protein